MLKGKQSFIILKLEQRMLEGKALYITFNNMNGKP